MILPLVAISIVVSAQMKPQTKPAMTKDSFGKTQDGQPVDLYTLINGKGFKSKTTNFGGIGYGIEVPHKERKVHYVRLGFNHLGDYLKGHPFFGAIAGRYANRIGKARFTLNGKEYQLAVNNGENSLHG